MNKMRWANSYSKYSLFFGMLLLLPAQLGAKGCEVGVVGDNEAEAGGSAGEANSAVGGATQHQTGIGRAGAGHAGAGTASTSTSASKLCGARLGNTCSKGQYCNYDSSAQCGATDIPGTCADMPEACLTLYAPVCGCDGKTYGNACTAASSGVSVARDGECDEATKPEGELCGGIAALKCPEGQYCDYPIEAKCGTGDQGGICKPRATITVDLAAPVCGCDNKTYSNPTEAAFNGMAIAHDGACETAPTGKLCGLAMDSVCPDGQFCNYTLEAQCGSTAKTGICTTPPTACILIDSPVCGCDGKTYSNECIANASRVAVAGQGACVETPKPTTCSAVSAQKCPDGQYCSYKPESGCGKLPNLEGTCASKPQVCPAILSPICGCDGKTYPNDCAAAVAGVSVASQGECGSVPTETACGGITGKTCPNGQYCNYPIETRCGSGDQMGVCEVKSSACITLYDPVCGCDGKSYPSQCDAAREGVSVASEGECPSTK